MGMYRARAYREMQVEAQRNKNKVNEQNNRVLDIMHGRNSSAKAALAAPAAKAVAAAAPGGRGQPQGPSAEER